MDTQTSSVEQLPPSTPAVDGAQQPPVTEPVTEPEAGTGTGTTVTADNPVEPNTETDTLETTGDGASPPSTNGPPSQDPPQEPLPESRPQSPHPPVPELEHAYWAEFGEDTSVPGEDEMKEIEANMDAPNYSASRYEHWEKIIFPDLEDPEYRPIQKARISWKIKGVRGTKDCPNRAKIMRSPPAYIGGYWWTIKFFPRGNNVSSMSIYYECSPTLPTPDKTLPETEFKVLSGAPDAVLNDGVPDLDLKLDRTDDTTAWLDHYKTQYPPAAGQENRPKDSWRVPVQIGMVIYNPDEPRTGWFQTACHQFNSHNLDWGWTNFHGPWDSIHCRKWGQRQPMLRNDTLAFDAYIRIIDDPTRFLWWHPSPTEPTWDSLGLTGYRPLGESVINHSAEVAGLSSWLHIAPFCKIIQSVDTLEHLTNCEVKPKPLCNALQKVLWQLRCRDESLEYVDTDEITSTLCNLDEHSSDVSEFFERLRRTLELELAGTDAGKEFAKLFDSPEAPVNTLPRDFNSRICIPADQTKTLHEGLNSYLSAKPGRWALPPLLHVELGRQKLDRVAHQWQLLYNRVDLDEELDLAPWVREGQSGNYTLYGYVVHRGRRASTRYFSILRPGGPGTRWLAFDDGSRNRVECLTRKTAFGSHLGLEKSKKPDQKNGHDVAVLVMYIRSDLLNEFLPGPQGPWEAPGPMMEYYETGTYPFTKNVDGESYLQVEVYSLPQYDQLGSLFDTYDLMSRAKSDNNVMYLTVPRSSTLVELRKKIALWKSSEVESIPSEHVRLWKIGHTLERYGPTLAFSRVFDLNKTLEVPSKVERFWMHVVSDEDAKHFAMPDPPKPVASEQKPEEAIVERSGSESPDDRQSDSEADASPTVSSDTPAPTTGEAVPTSNGQLSEQPSSPEGSNNDNTEHPTQSEESAAATPPSSGLEPNHTPQENADNDAIIAAIIANDIEMDTATPVAAAAVAPEAAAPVITQAQDEPSPESTTQQEQPGLSSAEPAAEPASERVEPAVLLLVEEQPPAEAAQPQPATNEDEPASEEPEVQLPVDHVYYFIQIFDVDNQALRTVGSFFSSKGETIKPELRKHMAWPDNKEFSIWQRVDGTRVTTTSSRQTFSSFIPDGTCFIVSDRLNKNKQTELSQAGLFSSPGHLVQYLWAESRHHPTQAFTGFKTIEPTFIGDYYSGEFRKGFYHGRGKHISDLAAIYEGDFISGRRHGKGTMEYPNGDTYEGDWFEDQRHGQGMFIERKTGNKYVGGYKDGKRHGKGISYWEVADEEMDLCQICYGEEQDALFFDCGHVCACMACAGQVDICPICRKSIMSVVKIYRT